jgi:ankyrin repeat protein
MKNQELTKEVFFNAIKSNDIGLALLFLTDHSGNSYHFIPTERSKGNWEMLNLDTDDFFYVSPVPKYDTIVNPSFRGMREKFINAYDEDGKTPLFLAIENNFTNLVKALLLLTEINPNKGNLNGTIPIFAALNLGQIEIVQFLIESEINLELQDSDGCTILHRVVEEEQIEIIRMLLDRNVEINSLDSDGNTALHLAGKIQNKEIISLLRDYGADTQHKNNFGEVADIGIIKR